MTKLFKLETKSRCEGKHSSKVHENSIVRFESCTLDLDISKCNSCETTVKINLPCVEKRGRNIAQFSSFGAMSISPGQPFTFGTINIASSAIIPTTSIFPPYSGMGTIFQLTNIGTYEVNFQTIYPDNGAVAINQWTSSPNLIQVPYSLTGKTIDSGVSNSILIQTLASNTFISLNASNSNVTVLNVPAQSSTNNTTVSTISIKQIG